MRILLIAAVAAIIAVGIPGTRVAALQALGRALIASDPLTPADAVVVSIDTAEAGVLEASDLVHSGLSKAVAVFAEAPAPAELELVRRGIPFKDNAARSIEQLAALGIPNAMRIETLVDGTGPQGDVLPAWAEQHHYRSLIVVTNSDHSRRLRRVLHRTAQGRGLRLLVRPSRYSNFNPNAWWHTRNGLRTGIIELQKLLLDYVAHPLS